MYGPPYFNQNGYTPLAGLGQQYDPALERHNLFETIKASIMGRPVQQPIQQTGRRIDPVMHRAIRSSNQPAPQSTGEGIAQGLGHIVDGFAQRHAARGPFPEMPGGGQPGPLMGLANMFGFSRGGLY